MKYYIDLNAWEQILKFLNKLKGIHAEDEANFRQFVEAIWYMVYGAYLTTALSYKSKILSVVQYF